MKQFTFPYCLIIIFLFLFPFYLFASSDTLQVKVTSQDRKVGQIRFIVKDTSNLILRVMDETGKPFKELGKNQVEVIRGNKKAKILKVVPLKSAVESNLNLVLALDNSSSMQESRKELLESVNSLLNSLKDKSRISILTFTENRYNRFKTKLGKKVVNISLLDFTSDYNELTKFVERAYSTPSLTQRTYLIDEILVGLQQLEKIPKNLLRVLVIFSDGKDLGSISSKEQLLAKAASAGITIYGIDFSGNPRLNPLMYKVPASTPQGKTFRAKKATELKPIFDKLTREIITEFQVTYHFPIPPTGDVAFSGDTLTITTSKLIDQFPMLNYVFFDSSSAEISGKYILFASAADAEKFDETSIQKPINKYYHILNVIGGRLTKYPDAKITLTGCNMNKGAEKKNTTLSRERAVAVKKYLEEIWKIDPARIKIVARNLPAARSSTRTPEGCAENCRVEISSRDYRLMQPVRSEVIEYIYSPQIGTFNTKISAPEGLKSYEFKVTNENNVIYNQTFTEKKKVISWNWLDNTGEKIYNINQINYSLRITDNDGKSFETAEKSIPIKQIEQANLLSKITQDSVFEKFSLVLFAFNSSTLKGNNQKLLQQVKDIFSDHPNALVKVCGYCDNIGSEEYNLKLSQKRAKQVARILRRMGIPKGQLKYIGYGEINPIFSNDSPEGRFLNRTVQIYVGYPVEENMGN